MLTSRQDFLRKYAAWAVAVFLFVVGWIVADRRTKAQHMQEMALAAAEVKAERLAVVTARELAEANRLKVEAAAVLIEQLSVVNRTHQTLLDGYQRGFMIVNDQGRVLDWNKAMERWTGFSEPDMLNQTLEKLMVPENYQAHESKFQLMVTAIRDALATPDPKDEQELLLKITIVECQVVTKQRKRVVPLRVSVQFVVLDGRTIVGSALIAKPDNVESLGDLVDDGGGI